MEKILIKLMLAAVVIVFMAPAAHSTVIVYEPFDYVAGDLVGQGGALGLDGNWGDFGEIEDTQVALGSLSHPIYGDLTDSASGNHAEVIHGDVGVDFLPVLADDGQDYWFSFLYQTVDPGAYSWFRFLFPDAGDPVAVLEINGGAPGMYSNMETWATISGAPDEGTVMWVVMKAETSGGHQNEETIYVWIDPDPSVEPEIANAGGSMPYDIERDDITE